MVRTIRVWLGFERMDGRQNGIESTKEALACIFMYVCVCVCVMLVAAYVRIKGEAYECQTTDNTVLIGRIPHVIILARRVFRSVRSTNQPTNHPFIHSSPAHHHPTLRHIQPTLHFHTPSLTLNRSSKSPLNTHIHTHTLVVSDFVHIVACYSRVLMSLFVVVAPIVARSNPIRQPIVAHIQNYLSQQC